MIKSENCNVCHALHDVFLSEDEALTPQNISVGCKHEDCDGTVYQNPNSKRFVETVALADITTDADLYNEDGDEIYEMDVITRQEQGY